MKKSYYKNLILLILLVPVTLFFSGCVALACPLCNSGSATARTLVEMNHFQDGETIGKDNSEIGFSLGEAHHIRGKITNIYENDSLRYKETATHSPILTATFLARNGISDTFDFLLAHLSVKVS